MPAYDTISFLSDYGLTDEFVGVTHSVIRSIAPDAQVVDLTHQIPPFDIRAGSLALVRSVSYLCPGIALAVVDPGVGGDRRGIAVEVGEEQEGILIGPDNGLLAGAVAMTGGARRVVELDNEKYQLQSLGPTFAGRDIFAPAAAHLCNGVSITDLGPEVDPLSLVPGVLPLPRQEDGVLKCEVLWVDRYGNAQLNAGPEDIEPLGDRISVRYAGESRVARRVRTFSELDSGELGILLDSYGMATLVFDQSSVAEQLRMGPSSEVALGDAT